MFYISERKHRKKEPEPTPSSSGQMYTRKNPDLKSPIPVVIEPTLEGTYQLPTCVTCLTYPDFRQGLFHF